MGKQADCIEVKLSFPPDSSSAIRLLHEIIRQKPVYSPRLVEKPLILYGAGNMGKMAREYFNRIGIPILFVVDANSDAYKDDLFWKNLDIIKPDDVSAEHKSNALLAVCVATAPYVSIYDYLHQCGWSDFVPFYDITEAYRDIHPLSNGWFSGELNPEDVSGIESVLSTLADDISRAHHLQFVAWRYLRHEWTFNGAPVTLNDRYFIPQVSSVLNCIESFLDVGAYHGNSLIKFMDMVGNKYKAIWAIEPDGNNFSVLSRNFAQLPSRYGADAQLLKLAVASTEREGAFFEGLGYASQLSAIGGRKISVRTIDALNIEPSYIKLHLEGAELDALKGAQDTIRRNRPIIAATTYHNPLGLWKLPLWLMQTTQGYRFYMRLHSWCGTGAVIYCVPEERNDEK